MKQSVRPAAPRARWRSGALGSLFAVVALAVGLAAAPAAVAAPASAAAPHLGPLRALVIDVDVSGAAPLGLDLSGAGIRFTSTTTATTGTCLTQGLGRCDVRWAADGQLSGDGTSSLRLPAGTYTVTQVAELPAPGLQPRTGTLATVSVCDCWHTLFGRRLAERSDRLEVPNASQYRHTVTARVVDDATGAPVPGARYRLTGPGFPNLLGDVAVVDAGIQRSNRDGELGFTAFLRAQVLRPGTWTLTPVDVPAPYVAAPVAVELTAAAPGGGTWAIGEVRLAEPPAPLPPATGSATLTLEPADPAPADLDLSGAGFELVGAGADGATGTCVTDAAGSCTVEVLDESATSALPTEGTAIALPAGTYAVRQTSAPTGLVVAEAIAPLDLCVSRTSGECATARTVSNAALYWTQTEVRVVSGNGPVAGVEVSLTGPDFEAQVVTTDELGTGSWRGWFLPGDWWFTVAGEDEPRLVTVVAGQGDTSLPWRVELTLTSDEPDAGGDSGSSPTTPATPPTTVPSTPTQAPAPVVRDAPAAPVAPSAAAGRATGGAGQPGAVARSGGAAPTGVAAPVEEVQEDVAAPAPVTARTPSSPAPPTAGGGQVFTAADGPTLTTESDSRLMTAGLVTGIGIFLVALVLTGYAVLRSRGRRRA